MPPKARDASPAIERALVLHMEKNTPRMRFAAAVVKKRFLPLTDGAGTALMHKNDANMDGKYAIRKGINLLVLRRLPRRIGTPLHSVPTRCQLHDQNLHSR